MILGMSLEMKFFWLENVLILIIIKINLRLITIKKSKSGFKVLDDNRKQVKWCFIFYRWLYGRLWEWWSLNP